MIDPVSTTVGACNFAVGAFAQIVPIVHDETTRKRLARLDVLLQKVENGSQTPEDSIESKKLHSDIQTHALMTQNATLLAHLDKRMLLLSAHKPNIAEREIDLITFDDDYEARPRMEEVILASALRPSSIGSVASLPEAAHFISFEEQMLLFGTKNCNIEHIAPSETTLSISSSRPSTAATSVTKAKDTKDPIIEMIANAKRPKSHANLKKAACWSLLLTTGPVALLAPQVRRNLLSPKTKF